MIAAAWEYDNRGHHPDPGAGRRRAGSATSALTAAGQAGGGQEAQEGSERVSRPWRGAKRMPATEATEASEAPIALLMVESRAARPPKSRSGRGCPPRHAWPCPPGFGTGTAASPTATAGTDTVRTKARPAVMCQDQGFSVWNSNGFQSAVLGSQFRTVLPER